MLIHRRIIVGCTLALAGCSESGPELGRVSGTVTLNGNPLVHAAVIFTPKAENPDAGPSNGTTDEAGKYTLNYGSSRKGAHIGQHGVMIHHADYANYGLSATVDKGDNTIDFALKEDVSKKSRRARDVDNAVAIPAAP